MRRSDAILATSLEVATPTDAVSWVCSLSASLSARAICSPVPNILRLPVTSRKASSMEMGSTQSVNPRSTSMTSAETAAYFSMSGRMYTPCGQRRHASEIGMALPTPNRRAS